MDLSLSSEQEQLRDAVGRALGRHLDRLVERLPEPPAPDPEAVWRDVVALGCLGLGVPGELGGEGTFVDQTIVHEEMGRFLAPTLPTTAVAAIRLLLHSAAPDRLAELLQPLVDGDRRAAVAFAEPGVDADPDALATTCRVSDGEAIVDGSKRIVPDAGSVDEVLVVAKDGADGRVVVVRVPLSSPGVTVTEHRSFAGDAQADLELRRCAVPAAHVVHVGTADPVERTLAEAGVLGAARMVGGARAVLQRTVDYVRGRQQFGRPIGSFQAVQHQLADVATVVDAAGLATWAAACRVDEEKASDAEVASASALARLAASDAYRRATLTAHQLHGGMGYVLDSPLHLWAARARSDDALPTSRRHVLDVLAAGTWTSG